MQTLIANVIWPVTLIMCILSIGIFSCLVVIRFYTDKKNLYIQNRKAQIKKTLLIHLETPLRDLQGALLLQDKDLPLLADILPHLLAVLSGGSRQRLLNDLQKLGFFDWIWQRLNTPDVNENIDLIRLIAYWPEDKVIDRLHSLLVCGYPLARVAAAEALASTKNQAHLSAIMQALTSNEHLAPALMCDILKKLGDDAVADLIDVLRQEDANPRLQQASLMALTESRESNKIPSLVMPLCGHANAAIRVLAYIALARAGIALPAALLSKALNDRNWRVRAAVVDCATNSTPVDLSLLLALLDDQNWLVALSAARALFAQGGSDQKLLAALAKQDSVRGRRARMMLAEQRTTMPGGNESGNSREDDYGMA